MAHRLFTAFAATLASCLAGPLLAASFAGVAVPPPPEPQPVSETFFGEKVEDPYRFLEDTQNAEVLAWMKSQAAATTAILDKLPGRAALLARISEIEAATGGQTASVLRVDSGRLFYLRRDAGDNQFRLVYRDAPDGEDKLVVDPGTASQATGKSHALMDFAPSPDGRFVVYALQVGGSEIGLLHGVELATGKPLFDPVDRIRYASAHWLDDSSGFFYARLREGYEKLPRGQRFDDRALHFRRLADAENDRVVFSASRQPELKLPVYASGAIEPLPGSDRALLVVSLGVERNRLIYTAALADVIAGKADWQAIAGPDDKIVGLAVAPGGDLYLRSAADAPRYQVLRLAAGQTDLRRAETVVAAGDSVITSLAATRDALYLVRRDGATLSLWRRAWQGDAGLQPVALPVQGSVAISGSTLARDELTLSLGGWTQAAKPWLASAGKLSALPLVDAGPFDRAQGLVVREVKVRSHDGVEVPMSILARQGLKLDGSHPAILYGYGAYGITENPGYNPRLLAWLERGGVFAIAHVRGGGAFGEPWHLAGKKVTKPNTWKDAIAAGEWLVAQGYTATGRLGLSGGSAGGILVGRAITERPDLFAAALPSVGSLDLLRIETRDNGPANIPEYGTVKIEAEYRGLKAMSTYEHIRPGTAYPAVMFLHGVNDIRVPVSQSLKTAARLAAATDSGKPVLLRLDFDAGHGAGSSRLQSQQRSADQWAFLLWQFGDPDFQPRP